VSTPQLIESEDWNALIARVESMEAGAVAHTLDSISHTDVAAMAEAKGDLLYRTGDNLWDRLAIGNNNEILYVNTDVPAWKAPPWLENLIEDTTPQLGGNLDCQSKNIIDVYNLDVEGTIVTFREGFVSRESGNILFFADRRFSLSTSGSIVNPANAFRIGDTYANINDTSLPIIVTVEDPTGFPYGTIASNVWPYIQMHGSGTLNVKVELKNTSGSWITVYADQSTTFEIDEIKFLGSTSSLSYPSDFPVKGIRFTLSNFTGTKYVPLSTPSTIESTGLNQTVALTVDTRAE